MANTPKLRIIPLGGVDEIGKNMTVFEYDRDIIVVDCGSMFPKDDMLGIDLVIPDASYLVANKERVRGYVFTHGHEDHIGAVPYVVSQVPAPLYGSRLTLALIENKLREHHVSGVPLNTVEARAGDSVGLLHRSLYQGQPLHPRRVRAGPSPAPLVRLCARATSRWTTRPSTAK